ncbi:hypothetical protein, partial [Heyndrickxia sporothermodurans]|uniref:hypothetical protein n=1 Tax=Heyndrickxia sporothermodurans TaxID=46224 RepID=UPI001C631B0C
FYLTLTNNCSTRYRVSYYEYISVSLSPSFISMIRYLATVSTMAHQRDGNNGGRSSVNYNSRNSN